MGEAFCSEYHYLYKLLLIGSSGVGKSCLTIRFADSMYEGNQMSTIGVDFKIKTIELDGKRVKLQLWDSAGQERFRALSSAYYRGAHGVGIVFDVTDEATFQCIEPEWFDEVDRHCPSIVRVLIGNKCDMEEEREVSAEEAMSLADRHGMKYIETSAKTSENVVDAFVMITQQVFQRRYACIHFLLEQICSANCAFAFMKLTALPLSDATSLTPVQDGITKSRLRAMRPSA